MRQPLVRPAVAMIELIFSIVIMSIVMLSAPMLISSASKSGYVSIQQENIGEVASQVNIILGYNWDENNANQGYFPVVLATNGDNNLSEVGTTGLRAGTSNMSFRKYISISGDRGTATPLNALGPDAADGDDIDDYNGVITLRNIQASTADYIEKDVNINIDSNITYMSDSANAGDLYSDGGGGILSFTPTFIGNAGNTSNIKRIQVTLTSASNIDVLDKNITLHAFSCNIGSYKLEERE